jgi:hypothetical protein
VIAVARLAQAVSDNPCRIVVACEVEASSHKGGTKQEETDW